MRQVKPRAPRVPVNLAIVIQVGEDCFQAIAVNLGMGGAFVASGPALGYGDRVEVLVELPGLPGPTRLPGLVRWSNHEGFGVQFQELGARETHAIGALVTQHHQEQSATERRERPSYSP